MTQVPKIKPLAWEAVEGSPRYEYSACGRYQIYFSGNKAETFLEFGARRTLVGVFYGDVMGEKARAAAQADHYVRTLLALDLSTRTERSRNPIRRG